jgi:hypothetical protein
MKCKPSSCLISGMGCLDDSTLRPLAPPAESDAAALRSSDIGAQQFERDLPVQLRILGQEHFTPPPARCVEHVVMLDPFPSIEL